MSSCPSGTNPSNEDDEPKPEAEEPYHNNRPHNRSRADHIEIMRRVEAYRMSVERTGKIEWDYNVGSTTRYRPSENKGQ